MNGSSGSKGGQTDMREGFERVSRDSFGELS